MDKIPLKNVRESIMPDCNNQGERPDTDSNDAANIQKTRQSGGATGSKEPPPIKIYPYEEIF